MYKNNINLNLYKDFYAVSKYGSLAKATSETYSSAPAISKSIKKLELELSKKYFFKIKWNRINKMLRKLKIISVICHLLIFN